MKSLITLIKYLLYDKKCFHSFSKMQKPTDMLTAKCFKCGIIYVDSLSNTEFKRIILKYLQNE